MLCDKHIHQLDNFVLFVAVAAPFSSIPQLLKVFIEQQAELSILSWSLYVLLSIPLVVYGIVHREKVVLFNAGLNMIMQLAIMVGILLYG